MSIENDVRGIAEGLGFAFKICDVYQANQWLRELNQFPCVLYIMPTSGIGEFTQQGMYKEGEELLLMFLDEDKIDPDGSETKGIINRMNTFIAKFIARLNDTRQFDAITSWETEPIIKDMSVVASGASVRLRLIKSNGVCL